MPKTAENFRQLCLKGPGDGYKGAVDGSIQKMGHSIQKNGLAIIRKDGKQSG